jgi:kelch-like protein 10
MDCRYGNKFRSNGVSYITYHGYVYVVGGFNSISSMCNGELYDLTNNAWTQIPGMCKHLSNFETEVTDHMIFSIGGLGFVTIT